MRIILTINTFIIARFIRLINSIKSSKYLEFKFYLKILRRVNEEETNFNNFENIIIYNKFY